MQKAYFPMDVLRVTQGRGVGSHRGTYAFDFGGKDSGKDKVYAPCDMKIVRVRTGGDSGEVYAQSVEPVLLPDGTTSVLHFTFIHDDSFNSNCTVGAVIKQGEYFYDEGGKSGGKAGVYAAHLHLEVGKGTSPKKQVKNGYGCWMTPNTAPIEELLWIQSDATILSTGGYSWTYDKDTKIVKPLSDDAIILQVGPASAGDRKAINATATQRGLPYSEDEAGFMYVGPASAGDQVAIISAAEELGLPCVEYKEPEVEADDRLNTELEALKAELNAAKAEIDSLQVQLSVERASTAAMIAARDDAINLANKYVAAIKTAVSALNV